MPGSYLLPLLHHIVLASLTLAAVLLLCFLSANTTGMNPNPEKMSFRQYFRYTGRTLKKLHILPAGTEKAQDKFLIKTLRELQIEKFPQFDKSSFGKPIANNVFRNERLFPS